MRSDKMVGILIGVLTIIPSGIVSLKLFSIPLANWAIILLFIVSVSAFILIIIFAQSVHKKKREIKSNIDKSLIQNDMVSDEYIQSLQKQLLESDAEQQYLSSLFNNAVTIIDELQIAADGIVPDTDRVQALYRRFEASGEKNMKTFIKKQQQKYGKSLELDKLIENN